MSAIPLELHEVLEEEYVATGGDPLPDSDAKITVDQIVDGAGCRFALLDYGIGTADDTPEQIAAHLEGMRVAIDPTKDECPARRFASSPRLSCDTGILLADYRRFNDATKLKVNRRILDDVFGYVMKRWRDVRLESLYAASHSDPHPRAALCISGGGIRSATFALGVLQGLARYGVLKRFDYLSTVSGGGYIGSWFSSWIRRHPEGVAGVESDLAALESQSAKGISPKIEPEAKPIRHLREYSNYLTPKTGVTSGDTWAFAALYLRNLLINLLVIVPILACVMALPRVSAFGLRQIKWSWDLLPIVVITDLSLLLLFWYIGLARPVRHGAEARAAVWPLSLVPQRWRNLGCCFVGGTGAAVGISAIWAKWVALSTDPGNKTEFDIVTMRAGVVVALVAMTIVPFATYFIRYSRATNAERRVSIASGAGGGADVGRFFFELGATLVSAVGGVALFWFFAEKVFDRPLTPLQSFGGSPFFFADKTLFSPRLLFICFGAPAVLFILFLQATLFVATASKRNEDYDREWWGRAGGWLLSGSVVWLVLSVVSIYGPLAIYRFPMIVSSLGGISGLVAILLGRSPKSGTQKTDTAAAATEKALAIAVPVFCLFLLAAISWLTTLIIRKVKYPDPPDRRIEAQLESVVSAPETAISRPPYAGYKEARRTKPLAPVSEDVLASHRHLRTVEGTDSDELLVIFGIGLLAFGASFAIGANRFSMHALYRNRLIRAYLGASRYERDPDSVTGFDPYDNIQIYKLRPELLWTSSIRDPKKFIDELRKVVLEGGAKDLSVKLYMNLQQATQNMLLEGTLDNVLSLLGGAATIDDDQLSTAARKAVQTARSHLPKTWRLLENGGDMDAASALAAKEVKKRRAQIARGGRRDVLDTIVQDVNRIFIEVDLTGSNLTGSARVRANRRKFDQTYADWVVQSAPDGRGPAVAAKDQLKCRPPLHVVNTALNLVGGRNLAWQQRQAESFTISPLHSGSAFIGYRDSRQYGDQVRGISLGTAVTISGAAASPNQGYHSSLPLAFLLTMFNVRLGWWLGNPGAAGKKTYGSENPTSTVNLLAREMFGETNDTYSWVYLSDGGHFENLGLYEMVLRRCRFIVVSDGGCDPKFTFEDLGNAIRKIRTDLGISITLTHMPMHPRDDDSPWAYVALGKIRYSSVDGAGVEDGTLVYLKPGYYADDDLPKDVLNYGRECADFPHETTADQWFTESQFESYRMLGRHVIEHIAKDRSLADKEQKKKDGEAGDPKIAVQKLEARNFTAEKFVAEGFVAEKFTATNVTAEMVKGDRLQAEKVAAASIAADEANAALPTEKPVSDGTFKTVADFVGRIANGIYEGERLAYVPVVAQQIRIKGDRRGRHAVVLRTGEERRRRPEQ